ncbi:hypothetical protein GCM10009851_34670 [Herbiconiux moechotypicola]|uniref:Transcriptional regulator LmrA/YxaF-like C-terminal domain-containing protein n=1 Tax=Herbiconiux moechotypicola TaxID=637393 RepID=A0ABN3E1C4_9MICO
MLEASGAPRGSLYHHFPGGKDELVLAAVGVAGDRAVRILDSLAGQPAPEIATAFLALWRAVLVHSEYAAGCAVAAVTVAAGDGALLDRAGEVFRTWRARLAELLAEGGVDPAHAPALAVSLIAGAEGAVVLARAERDISAFDLVAGEQLAAVEAAVVRGRG